MQTAITYIPLSKLVHCETNIRKSGNDQAHAELVASIDAHGLLQNLGVRRNGGDKYYVIAGGRRLRALQALAEQGKIDPETDIPCNIANDDADTAEISLAENVVREPMHPADEAEAFSNLVNQGKSITDIAARFGVSETVVKKRLKLATVSPKILAAYRDGKMGLEQVQAFAVTDDHKRQEKYLKDESNNEGELNESPNWIRRAMTESKIPADDYRLRLVTLDAFEAAGGIVIRDLFAEEGGTGAYIEDVKLLDKLFEKALSDLVAAIKAEGWGFVMTDFKRSEYEVKAAENLLKLEAEREPLSADAKAQIKRLQDECDAIEAKADKADRITTAEEDARMEALEEKIAALEETPEIYAADFKAKAGVLITKERWGNNNIEIIRGLYKKAEIKETKVGKAEAKKAEKKKAEKAQETAGLSTKLIESLSRHKTYAIAATLIDNQNMAFRALVHAMMNDVFGNGLGSTGLTIEFKTRDLGTDSDVKGCHVLIERFEMWEKILPKSSDGYWKWCLDASQERLVELMAFCVAMTVEAGGFTLRTLHDKDSMPNKLAAAINLDIRGWFAPDIENYFGNINKATLLSDLKEIQKAEPTPLILKLKREGLSQLCEREAAATGNNWMPAPLRIPGIVLTPNKAEAPQPKVKEAAAKPPAKKAKPAKAKTKAKKPVAKKKVKK